MKAKELIESLYTAGMENHVLTAAGGQMVAGLRGGRVMGIFPDTDGENLLWTPDKMKLSDWNVGGDRTWLGPESQFHVPTPDADWAATYFIPESVDPGAYQFTAKHETWCRCVNTADIRHGGTGETCTVNIETALSLTAPPFGREESNLSATARRVGFIGYTLENRLEFVSGPDEAWISLWRLAQIPPGGSLRLATNGKGSVRNYFEATGPSHLAVNDDHVAFKIDGRQRHKIGVSALSATGRMGYIRPLSNGRCSALIRSFQPVPGAVYIDTPAGDMENRFDAIQCYNDDGGYGGFGEMEYHSPAVNPRQGRNAITDVSRTWGFVGETDDVIQLSARLLNLPADQLKEGL